MLSGCYCLSTCYPMAQMPILPARRRSSCQRCVHSLTTRILRLILGSKSIAACWRKRSRRAGSIRKSIRSIINETCSADMGFYYRLERKKIEGEEESEQQAVAQGRGMTPTDQQPGAPTLADYQQQGGEERESDMNRQDLALVMQMIQDRKSVV